MHGTISKKQSLHLKRAVRYGVRFLKRDESGLAAIEFAAILPVFVALMFGTVNFGHVIYAKHSMQRVAGETMRAVAYGELSPSDAQKFAKKEMESTFGNFSGDQLKSKVKMLPGGDEFTVTIEAATARFDLVDYPFVTVSDYVPSLEVMFTGKVITRFDPTLN